VLDEVRYLLSFMPSNNMEEAPRILSGDDPNRLCEDLRDILPSSPNLPYDMKKVITRSSTVVITWRSTPRTPADHLRLRAHRRTQCRHRVQSANVLAGVLDIDSSEKAARFVRTCDAFNIPS